MLGWSVDRLVDEHQRGPGRTVHDVGGSSPGQPQGRPAEDVSDLLEQPLIAVLATRRKDDTVMLSPFISPVSRTVCPACIARSA